MRTVSMPTVPPFAVTVHRWQGCTTGVRLCRVFPLGSSAQVMQAPVSSGTAHGLLEWWWIIHIWIRMVFAGRNDRL